MGLVSYAERELRAAGLFDEDSAYDGNVGRAVLEMVQQFAGEGHSGNSAAVCLAIFARVAKWKPLVPIQNPMKDGAYQDCDGQGTLQSTRLSTLFSDDAGKHWYDLDKPLPGWKRWLGVRRAYVTFPYFPA